MRPWILLALVVACAPERRYPPGWRGIDGHPSDVHTSDGVYDGYRVTRQCPIGRGEDRIGVLGTGDACFEGVCGDYGAQSAAFQAFRLELRAEIPFVWSGDGLGSRCTHGDRMAAHLTVYDWRAVDEAVRRVGAFLRKRGLREEVVISVEGDPIPL